jgi:hypothetical protein
MTDVLVALTLVTGIVSAECLLVRHHQASLARFDDNERDDVEPPRLDHAAPGRRRTPLAICLILERARALDALAEDYPCT